MKTKHASVKLTIECHCMGNANLYQTRVYTNQLGHKVYKSFYRCENCYSRINDSICPEFDDIPQVNVMDLLKQKNQK